jgi:hypothetical protein
MQQEVSSVCVMDSAELRAFGPEFYLPNKFIPQSRWSSQFLFRKAGDFNHKRGPFLHKISQFGFSYVQVSHNANVGTIKITIKVISFTYIFPHKIGLDNHSVLWHSLCN